MNNFFKKLAFKLTGNKLTQKLLENNISLSQKLLGIGYGTNVENSGEMVIIEKLLELNKPEVTIFDVGANKGDFSQMILSHLTGIQNFYLHSFEPSKITFAELRARIKKQSHIHLNNFALGKNETTADLFYEKAGSGLASLAKRNLSHLNIDFNESEKVDVKTVDAYCAANKIKLIDLLKIDVEGYEMDVLSGSVEMFDAGLIKMVSFEFGGCHIDTRIFYRDFFYFFKKYNMNIYRIIPSAKLILMKDYKEMYEQFTTTNFFAY